MNIIKYRFILLIAAANLVAPGCKKIEEKKPEPLNLGAVENALSKYKSKADILKNPDTDWLNNGCDALLWESKYSSVTMDSDIRATEYDGSPGRFGRTPIKRCFSQGEDNGSKSTWSRDMGMGLILWAWRANALDVLEDHERYGRENTWKMGEPIADGRVLYTPQMIGILYSVIHAMGGANNANRHWPTIWTKGLVDYQAHLQMMSILIQYEIEKDIKKVMYERIVEHSDREPNNVFYQALKAKFTGNYDKASELCVNGSVGDYVRLSEDQNANRARLSELIFSCDLILRAYESN